MANFSFALRLALGFLPKTEKIEEERNQLIAELNRLNEYAESDELKQFNKLSEFVNSAEFKAKKAEITGLSYATSDYCAKEKKYNNLKKDKQIANYFKVLNSDDYKSFLRINESDTVKRYLELTETVNSAEHKNNKVEIDKAYNEEKSKTDTYKKLKKSAEVKGILKLMAKKNIAEADLKESEELAKNYSLKNFVDSGKWDSFRELEKHVTAADYERNLEAMNYRNSKYFKLEEELKGLEANADIKFWKKFQASKQYKMFCGTEGSALLGEYNELEALVNSDEFKSQKAYLLDKNRFNQSEEAAKEREFEALKNSENIKWYQATVNSNKFDALKAWKLTFEDDFADGKVDEKKWLNTFFMGKLVLNDRYVLAGDKQYYTDNKNFDIKNSVLSIVTKKEKATGKVWDAKHGFSTQDFEYTSGLLSTANSFRQQNGKFEAKIKIDAEAPVYQAFWLKGEKKEPQIDVFKFNVGKKGSMQMSTYDNGKAAGTKLGGSALGKDFFIYSVEWEANKITWKINNVEVATATNAIPQEPLFIMLSAGLTNNELQLPSNFQIDWVRCYEKA